MSVLLFSFSFLATGIVGVTMLGSFEIQPTERIGAEAFLFLLCVGSSAVSVLFYLQGSRRFQRHPGVIWGLFGSVVAAGTFGAAAGAFYLGLGFAPSVTLALVLPSLAAFVWPLLTAKT